MTVAGSPEALGPVERGSSVADWLDGVHAVRDSPGARRDRRVRESGERTASARAARQFSTDPGPLPDALARMVQGGHGQWTGGGSRDDCAQGGGDESRAGGSARGTARGGGARDSDEDGAGLGSKQWPSPCKAAEVRSRRVSGDAAKTRKPMWHKAVRRHRLSARCGRFLDFQSSSSTRSSTGRRRQASFACGVPTTRPR
jgi:hypothetical protein